MGAVLKQSIRWFDIDSKFSIQCFLCVRFYMYIYIYNEREYLNLGMVCWVKRGEKEMREKKSPSLLWWWLLLPLLLLQFFCFSVGFGLKPYEWENMSTCGGGFTWSFAFWIFGDFLLTWRIVWFMDTMDGEWINRLLTRGFLWIKYILVLDWFTLGTNSVYNNAVHFNNIQNDVWVTGLINN